MSKIYNSQKGDSIKKLPQGRQESKRGEFEHPEKGIAVCPECHNIFYKKEWHHPDSKKIKELKKANKEIHFKICPACTMAKEGTYEGEILIKGLSLKYEADVVHLITSFSARAKKRDPQDRVIKIEKQKDGVYRILTTENQLAVRLAKGIHNSHKKSKIHVAYSKEPYEVSRVSIEF